MPAKETFIAFLRRAASDQEVAGRPATADDYRAAATRLDLAEQAIVCAVVTLETRKRLPSDLSYALARLRDALKEIK